ncbi:hypothetical protein F5050DRAFT_1746478 [Lentinula boryana]|uniref:Uncharacterized protein n=1 Tax=Lentinula boryana TaxID=40481 RepID=A0ABQ8QI38_9AGAR|nr:hypothetical protein F5050DRAFT_1746478 [Lentinula boryana]
MNHGRWISRNLKLDVLITSEVVAVIQAGREHRKLTKTTWHGEGIRNVDSFDSASLSHSSWLIYITDLISFVRRDRSVRPHLRFFTRCCKYIYIYLTSMFLIFALLRVAAMNGEFIYSLPSTSTSSRDDPLPVYRRNSQPTPSPIQPYGLEFSGSTVMESTSQSTTKSAVTPLRKHHKLLKDGSGHEVWPEFVEQIFVDGKSNESKFSLVECHDMDIRQ